MLVNTIKTEITSERLVEGLVLAWFSLFNEVPSKDAIGVLFSQCIIENGYGMKSCYNYNVGNVKYDGKSNVDYYKQTGVWEIINGKKVILDKENPGAWFRSFDSVEEGLKFHLDLLKNRKYKSAWKYVIAGDMSGFVKDLKSHKYFTASLESYLSATNSIFSKYKSQQLFERVLSNAADTYLDNTGDSDIWYEILNKKII